MKKFDSLWIYLSYSGDKFYYWVGDYGVEVEVDRVGRRVRQIREIRRMKIGRLEGVDIVIFVFCDTYIIIISLL